MDLISCQKYVWHKKLYGLDWLSTDLGFIVTKYFQTLNFKRSNNMVNLNMALNCHKIVTCRKWQSFGLDLRNNTLRFKVRHTTFTKMISLNFLKYVLNMVLYNFTGTYHSMLYIQIRSNWLLKRIYAIWNIYHLTYVMYIFFAALIVKMKLASH